VAEREGFEPSVEVSPHTRLAGEHLQPTRSSLRIVWPEILAEGVGFEPTNLSVCGFQDRRLKPLGHPSNKIFLPFCSTYVNLIAYDVGKKLALGPNRGIYLTPPLTMAAALTASSLVLILK
jgi:hypothetical protein